MKAGFVFLLTGIICFLSSCDKSDKEKLTQKWQLQTITIKATEETHNSDSIFFNFQKEMFQYQRVSDSNNVYSAYGFFERNGDSIQIQYINNNLDPALLLWNEMNKSFYVKHLSGKRLELEDEEVVYKLRSF